MVSSFICLLCFLLLCRCRVGPSNGVRRLSTGAFGAQAIWASDQITAGGVVEWEGMDSCLIS